MTIERLVYNPEDLKKFGFRAVSVLVFGETSLLLKLNSDGIFAVEPIEPSDRTYFEKETKDLTPANQVHVPGINAYQIDYLQQERDSVLKIKWAERTTSVDEPTLEIPTEDVVNYERAGLRVSEQELMDLFGLGTATTRKAAFFTLDTAENEVAGIILRRATPVLFFVRPQTELGKLSTLTGLNTFLTSIYSELTQRATDVQKQVDRAVFEASLLSNGKLEFVLAGSKKKLADVHQKIYQIQCLLLALHADPKLGTQDPKLLAIAPFLKAENGGGLKLFRPQAPKPVQIDNSIWEKLIEKPKQGFVSTPSARVTSRPQRVVKTPSPAVQQAPRVEALTTSKSEKDKAVELAAVLVRGVESTASYLKDTNHTEFNLKKIKELESKTANLAQLAGKYLETRKRGKTPPNPTATRIGTVFNGQGFSSIRASEIYNFLTKEGLAVDFRTKVDEALERIQKQIIPLFRETPSKQERTLAILKTNRRLLKDEHLSLSSTISAVERIAQSNNMQGEIYVGELGLALLLSQITYVLSELIQELKLNGQAVEIDNWVNYCYVTFDRLSHLLSECYAK